MNKFKCDEQQKIASILEDINSNNLRIHSAVFDKPKRCTALCIMSQSAYYPCEYCECKAQLLTDDQRPEKKQLVLPYETITAKPRTINSIRQIADRIIENGGPLPRDEAKGIKGKSHFLTQPHFNMIADVPCEYMHLGCLGVVKRLVSLTFKVGEIRDRVTKRKLSDPNCFNQYIRNVQVVREFGRRCRNLDVSVYKAQEYRNLILFFFPLVIKCIEPTYTEEIKLWYLLVFMMRSCVLPNHEFRNLPDRLIANACDNFYRLFQKLFGKKNCIYSVHVFSSHLLKIRGTMPLTFKSAFKFESFYAEMKNMYVPGTLATTKQILQNCYVKRSIEYHKCEKTIFYDSKKKPEEGKPFVPGLENNSLIYTTDENNNHTMYVIIDLVENNSDAFLCIKQGKFKFNNALTPNIPWTQVGVYKLGPTLNEEQFVVQRDEISGKVLKVDNFLITCPLNVLQEK